MHFAFQFEQISLLYKIPARIRIVLWCLKGNQGDKGVITFFATNKSFVFSFSTVSLLFLLDVMNYKLWYDFKAYNNKVFLSSDKYLLYALNTQIDIVMIHYDLHFRNMQ